MEIQKPSRRRRHHPEEFKQAVIAACCETGASVAGIALANGINANQVRRWMRERGIEVPEQRMLKPVAEPGPAMAPEFVQLPIAPAEPASRDIRIEIRRGNTAVKVDWPVQASGDCAAWLRDWLR
ncbi:MAG: transposase [Gammaproteobacteria bacterium]|nr:transposase [Gammaproteobacteria bacterium]MBU1601950.1 transposase [Gammaproteobacteria bacterium]MBU2433927.1 transposase [Gammaproteobacteria bacterium]MBU2447750.1 transposase [Gammaproteobacteria bacterium]